MAVHLSSFPVETIYKLIDTISKNAGPTSHEGSTGRLGEHADKRKLRRKGRISSPETQRDGMNGRELELGEEPLMRRRANLGIGKE